MFRLCAAFCVMAAVLSAAPAAADHCRKQYNRFRAESEKLERLAERAAARGDIAAECKALDQQVALAKREVREIKPSCFHNPAFAGAGEAKLRITEDIRDMTCDPDYDWDELEDW